MGLRVATLVNLSFVGGDLLDESAARFVGHSARTRVIPEGIRRFATWAPLLIPFYIPRGAEWDHAWNGAEAVRAAHAALSAPVAAVLARLRDRGGRIGARALARALARAGSAARRAHRARRHADAAPAREPDFVLDNGTYSLELSREGLGYSRVVSTRARRRRDRSHAPARRSPLAARQALLSARRGSAAAPPDESRLVARARPMPARERGLRDHAAHGVDGCGS